MAVGLVPVCSGINIPWTTPAIISGFLATNWVGALLQALLLVMGVFIKAMDDEYLKEEKENVSKMDEVDEADAIDLDNLSFDDL